MTEEGRTDPPPKLEIDWLRIAAGALAAVCSAVLLSTLGAVGTIAGAALGSVIVSLGTALYSQGLAHSRARMARAQELARRKVGLAQAEVRRAQRLRASETAAEGHLRHADEELGQLRADLSTTDEPEADRSPWRERLATLPWKRIGLVALAMFVVAVVVITVFELIAGRPVASFTGGSDNRSGLSWTHLEDGSSKQRPARQTPGDEATPTPTDAATPTETPTPETTEAPTVTPTPSESAPPTPTGTPTEPPPEATPTE